MAAAPRRLSFEDAGFLYYERPEAPLHVGSLGIYEGRIDYEAAVRHLQSRIHTIPRYRQRVRFVPLNLGHPVWEDDPDFDITNHVRRYRLPRPVDEAGLARVVARLFAPRLDYKRPPWDVTLIEGLGGDRTALLCRAHHCMVDGVSGLELLVAMLDLTPAPRKVPPPKGAWKPEASRGAGGRAADALWEWTGKQMRAVTDAQMMLVRPRHTLQRVSAFARAFQKCGRYLLTPPPSTAINTPVKRLRAYAWTEMSFADLRAIRSQLGGTVNDVVLTVLTGALRRYLSRRSGQDLPREVRVLVPVNVRHEDEQGALGNRVSFMMLGAPLAVTDPLERFRLVRRSMSGLKRVKQAEGLDIFIELLGQIPPAVAPRASLLPTRVFTSSNLVCTNVPGPMVPLYCTGHRLLAHYPLVPVSYDLGVNVGVMSYNQRLFWGLLTNAESLPDPWRLARDIDGSLAELIAASGVAPAQLPVMTPPTAPARRRPRGASVPSGDGASAGSRTLVEQAATIVPPTTNGAGDRRRAVAAGNGRNGSGGGVRAT